MISSLQSTSSTDYLNQIFGSYSSSSRTSSSLFSTVNNMSYTNYSSYSKNSYNYASQISTEDTTFLKNVSNNSASLYSSASKLTTLKNSSKTSNEDIQAAAENFIKDYNTSIEQLSDNKSRNSTTKSLYTSLSGVATTNQTSLSDMGITIGTDGKLSMDTEKFQSSLTSNADKVKSALAQVGKKAQSSALNTMSTSTQSLLKESSTTSATISSMSEEEYNAAITKIASNRQYMSSYYYATAALSMMNLYI